MKKILLPFVLLLFATMAVNAQNYYGKSTDAERIAIAPSVPNDLNLPMQAQNALMNKMRQLVTRAGLGAAGGNPIFIISPSVTVLSEQTAPTQPPMTYVDLEISFFISDRLTGNIYEQTTTMVKGMGGNRLQALVKGVNNVNVSDVQYRRFLDNAKQKIVEFYNSKCDFVLMKAKSLRDQGQNNEALEILNAIPEVSKECYQKAMELASTIQPKQSPASAVDPEPVVKPKPEENKGGHSGSRLSVALEENFYWEYDSHVIRGEKLIVKSYLKNKSSDDIMFKIYVPNIAVYNNQGEKFECTDATLANEDYRGYAKSLIMPDIPVEFTFEFPKTTTIAMLVMEYNGNTYKIRNIPNL
jgi:hypothetical protein